jgi:hypothetical protein
LLPFGLLKHVLHPELLFLLFILYFLKRKYLFYP